MSDAPVVVVGSGAGGATVAHTLAERGLPVVVLEEGDRHPPRHPPRDAVEAIGAFYRNRGVTPILGRVPIGFVEGIGVGGSTEINSGFWHRTPRETVQRWRARFGLEVTPEELDPCFAWAEQKLQVGPHPSPWPPSSALFARGAAAMGWAAEEIHRTASGCVQSNLCAHGCPSGAKQGVARRLLPEAEAMGVRLIPRCRVGLVLRSGRRITGVLAERLREDGTRETIRIDARAVVIAAGPTQTPGLLRRSGHRYRVGATLGLHPMLKVLARFPGPVDAERSVLPLLQVKGVWPDVSLGGSFVSRGHLALLLSDTWRDSHVVLRHRRELAAYYVAVRGSGHGAVRPAWLGERDQLTYQLSEDDERHLSQGLARLSSLLLAAGALEVWATVQGLPPIRREVEAVRWLDERLPPSRLSLTTVHLFSTCPAGEDPSLTAVDSFGRLRGVDGLVVADASVLPDSPGVNPQGSVMALARRNALALAERLA